MTVPGTSGADDRLANDAFLALREGGTWSDVFQLLPGESATIGRTSANRIVLRNGLCSRHHCEIFSQEDEWGVRDLNSRNGTFVNGQKLGEAVKLTEGDIIQVGNYELTFSHSDFDEFSSDFASDFQEDETKIVPVTDRESDTIDDIAQRQPTILHRRGETKYLRAGEICDNLDESDVRKGSAHLCQLAFDMSSANDVGTLTRITLQGLLSATNSNIGAILLLPRPSRKVDDPNQLQVVAYRSPKKVAYRPVSRQISELVLDEREGILAEDIHQGGLDSDSLDEMRVESVICTPIRRGERIYGLIHLYSLDNRIKLTPDALDFSLAVAEQLALSLNSVARNETLRKGLKQARTENESLRQMLAIESELVGSSDIMKQLRKQIALVANADATVLVRGESGVGKELVARAIHMNSVRRDAPFVCVNCAALSETLLESELFGHEKGAFTGAIERKAGRFEQANHGTLFLDEVGEMSPEVQAKFLRVLEGHSFERVGGNKPVRSDVRVIAATNRDLEIAVKEKKFRKDLYFRLQILELLVPPLSERRQDIPELIDHFLQVIANRAGTEKKTVSDAVVTSLKSHKWLGNVRELKNTMERAAILAFKTEIQLDHLHFSSLEAGDSGIGIARRGDSGIGIGRLPGDSNILHGSVAPNAQVSLTDSGYLELSLAELEQQHIMATLEFTEWNKRQASRILGIERTTLDRKLKRYGVETPKRTRKKTTRKKKATAKSDI